MRAHNINLIAPNTVNDPLTERGNLPPLFLDQNSDRATDCLIFSSHKKVLALFLGLYSDSVPCPYITAVRGKYSSEYEDAASGQD